MRFSRLLLASTALAAIAVPGYAQTTSTGEADAAEAVAQPTVAEETDDAIVVTGSRIRRPNLDSPVPITSIGGEEFFETGTLSVGDTLNDLPQLRSTFSQANSTRFLGTRGLNLLDLRGLGTARTLVLQNGRRHVAGDVLSTGVSPDVNTIPTDLIERVEVTTGGASSVYGSDAIAGVVNFILKDDFEGIQVRGQGGISKNSDAENFYGSFLVGQNFGADDRGNVALNVEYARQEDYYASSRGYLDTLDGFVTVDTDPAGAVNGSDGVADRVFFRDLRSATISLGGQLGINAANGSCGRDSTNAAFTCGFLFQPDGSLVAQTGQRVGLAPNGNYVGGNGYNSRVGKLVALSPQLERISTNLLAHYEISPAFVPFVEAKYVRSDALGSQSGPFFSQGATLGDTPTNNREQFRLDNPFLSAQARATIVAARTAAGQTSTDATRIALRRNYLDLGIRDEDFRRETYRAVGGLRGDFNDDWNYELSVNYGEHRENNTILGNVNVQRYLLAVDSVRDPATGQIVCRSRIDPTAARGLPGVGGTAAEQAAILAADVAACTPLNPFGEGNISDAARNYVLVDSRASGKITQFVGSGFVAGDTSQFFELPGGPIGFSVGAEYRRETLRYELDDLTQAGYAFYNAIPSFQAPANEVKEVFGEVRIPVLADLPFAQELTLNASGRISDYKGSTGTVYTYAGSVDYKPVEDLTLRGSYSRAIRAPNLAERFSEQSQNFAPAPNDPCSERNIGAGSQFRAANCQAAGRPAGYDFVYTSSLEIRSGGNPELTEETSTSYTIGGILTPQALPGFSLSVDYFDITVNDVITSVTAQAILDNCYDSPTLNNPFCASFQRAGAGGGPRGEQAFRVLEGSLLASTLNFAKLTARGVDFELGYRSSFDWGSMNLRAIYTRTLERNSFLDPSDPSFANRLLGEIGDPENQVNFNADFEVGKFTVGYELRWIDNQYIDVAGSVYENYNTFQGRAPQNADFADVIENPDVFYHDIRFGYDFTDNINAYVGVDNLFNRTPPFGSTGVSQGSGIYDNRGQFFYGGFVAKF